MPFYKILIKGKTFAWVEDYENAFTQQKEYLSSPPILTRLETRENLFLYIAVSDRVVGIALIAKRDGDQRPIYYTSKVLHSVEMRYQKIKKLAYAIVLAYRQLKHYSQAHPIII